MQIGLNLPPQVRVYSAFFLYSLAFGGLYPRLGDLQLAMGIGEGALGAALVGTGLGTLISLTFASPILDKIGYRRTLIIGIIIAALMMGVVTLTTTPIAMFAVLFCGGLLIGAIEVVINVEADRTEHLLGRRVMNRCHAFWSFGFFAAGLIGAGMKQAGISPQMHLWSMVPIIAIGVVLTLGRMAPAAARTGTGSDEHAAPKFAMPSLGILALVAFTLSSMFLEGAGADWSVIFMRDVYAMSPFVNGLAFAIGALAQAGVRFYVDGVIERYGPIAVARVLIAALGAGALMVTFTQHPALALLGFALMGVGTSAIFPLAMSAAAQRTDRPAAINVAALAQVSFVAFLLGPPLLGFVAEHYGARAAFGVCLPLVVLSWFAVRSLAPLSKRPAQTSNG